MIEDNIIKQHDVIRKGDVFFASDTVIVIAEDYGLQPVTPVVPYRCYLIDDNFTIDEVANVWVEGETLTVTQLHTHAYINRYRSVLYLGNFDINLIIPECLALKVQALRLKGER